MIDWHTHFVAQDLDAGAAPRGAWPAVARAGEGITLTLAGAFYREIDERTFDPAARIAEFVTLGVDVQVLSPPPVVLAFDGPQNERVSLARQQNDAMLRAAVQHPDRFRVLAMLPVTDEPQAVTDAVAEIARLARHTAVAGVCLVAGRHDYTLGSAVTPRWGELWSAVDELGWLIFVHPDASALCDVDRTAGPPFGFALPTATGRFATRLLTQPWAASLTRLRVLLAHAGGTLPATIDRLDKAWQMAGSAGESPLAVARRAVWVDSVSYGRAPCCAALEALGPDRLVHGSDYPFAAGVGLDDLATLGDDLVHAADRGSMSLASALTTVI